MDEIILPLVSSILQLARLVYKIILIYVFTIVNLFKTPKRKNIRNQNVLITGSGHGLGRELALRFAQHGANIVLVDINETNNESVKEELLRIHGAGKLKVFAYSVDIRQENKVAELAAKVQKDLGDIDILVNNAGIVQCLPFLELSASLVERTFQVNTLAHFWTIKHFLPGMIKNKRGHIVAVSSIAGLIGNKYLTDYCASKFAIVGLMEALDREIHSQGANKNIRLTTVCPTCMSTGMFQTFTSRFDWLLPVLKADGVAKRIVNAVLTNRTLIAIPSLTLFLHRLSWLIPNKVNYLVQDYLDYGVKPHTK